MTQPEMSEKPVVLIAEDDPDDRFLLETAFREFEGSVHVEFAIDGERLMEYLDTPPPPALVMLDLNMPKIDGREALLRIKKRADLEGIPIVIWTTSNEEEDRIFCAKAGAADYVIKPFEFQQLSAAIKDIARRWLRPDPEST